MTIASRPKRKLTFAEYLDYDDGTDNRYELMDGALIALPPESGWNIRIAFWLAIQLAKLVGLGRVVHHSCELQVSALKPGYPQNRYPDLVVLREEHIDLTRDRMTITLDMPPPDLVVEVVSPGKANRHRDYIEKREQYAACGIPEYWVIDPKDQTIVVLRLENGAYVEFGQFKGNERIISQVLPELKLTAVEILQDGDAIDSVQ